MIVNGIVTVVWICQECRQTSTVVEFAVEGDEIDIVVPQGWGTRCENGKNPRALCGECGGKLGYVMDEYYTWMDR